MIRFSCPCGVSLKVKDEYAGRSTKCPTCKQPITVPAVDSTDHTHAGMVQNRTQAGLDGAASVNSEAAASPQPKALTRQSKSGSGTSDKPAELPRGIVTIMFTDIVGSTRLKNLMPGDTGARRDAGFRVEIKDPHDAIVLGESELSEGHVVNSTGDGYCVAFLDVEEAVLCALRIQNLLATKPVVTPDGPLRVRIGLHTGMADPAKDHYTASTLDKASRVQSRAEAGTVLLSRECHALVMGKIKSVSFVRAGSFQLKGLEAEELYRAEHAVAAAPGKTRPNNAPVPPKAVASPGGLLAPPRSPDEIGWLAHYRVLKVLGQGGMGVVYHAEDTQLQRSVALKAVLPELARDDATRQRFLREARATAAIKSDHIVTIHQVGMENDTPYLVMEFLQGEALDEWLERGGGVTVEEIVRIGREIALGLGAAHQRGLIHRDIKPSNVWLEAPRGRVKLLDFGLARPVADNQHITQSGMVLGTPTHMAPEQARGEPTDARADLFSLGCVLYRLCTGRVPFSGGDSISTLVAVATETPPPPQEISPAIPAALSSLVMQLLAKKVERRPPSAQAVCDILEGIAQRLPHSSLPVVHAPLVVADDHELANDEAEDEDDSDGTMHEPSEEEDEDSGERSAVRTQRKSMSKSRRRRAGLPVPWIVGGIMAAVALLAVGIGIVVTLLPPRHPPPFQPPGPQGSIPGPKDLPPGPQGNPEAKLEVTWPAAGETGDYLKSLVPKERQSWHLMPPKNPGLFDDGSKPPERVDDYPVRVQNKRYSHSFFMHPAPPRPPNGGPPPGPPEEARVSVTYRLGKQYRVFHALVSLNDGPPRSELPLTFKVIGDGRTLWTSKPVSSQADIQRADVDVKGVDTFTIEVATPGGDPRGCHAVWIEPYLVK